MIDVATLAPLGFGLVEKQAGSTTESVPGWRCDGGEEEPPRVWKLHEKFPTAVQTGLARRKALPPLNY